MKASLLICVSLVALIFVGTGCSPYEVLYTAEWKEDGSCIKFEDAMRLVDDEWVEACLGEDGAVQADGFPIELDGDPEDIETVMVSVKAGKCKEQDIPLIWDEDEEVWEGIGCDFQIVFAGPIPLIEGYEDYEGYYALGILSDDDNKTPALSNITVCFSGEGVTVLGPPEGDCTALRQDSPAPPD